MEKRDFLKISGSVVGSVVTGLFLEGLGLTPLENKPKGEVPMVPSQIRPHFKARDKNTGNLVEIRGVPKKIVTKNDKISIEFFDKSSNNVLYVDPVAIQSDVFGEHPAVKTLRLKDQYNLAVNPTLEAQLKDPHRRDDLCHGADFEYLPEKKTTGVVAEIATDGSAIMIIKDAPPEWKPKDNSYLTPGFFSVTPNKLISPKILHDGVGYWFDPEVYGKTLYQKAEGILQSETCTALYSFFGGPNS